MEVGFGKEEICILTPGFSHFMTPTNPHMGGLAEINLERCIGCGLCVITCPAEAMELKSKPDNVHLTPPVTSLQQMALMAEKRRASLPSPYVVGKENGGLT
ncbi:MAG: 4Fe-4S binding protein [Pseudomonadota bacterium]